MILNNKKASISDFFVPAEFGHPYHTKPLILSENNKTLAVFLRTVLEKMCTLWWRKVFAVWVSNFLINYGRYLNWVSKYYLNHRGPKRGMVKET